MDPYPDLEHTFPLRDVQDPVNRVDADYVDSAGRVPPSVSLQGVGPALDLCDRFSRDLRLAGVVRPRTAQPGP